MNRLGCGLAWKEVGPGKAAFFSGGSPLRGLTAEGSLLAALLALPTCCEGVWAIYHHAHPIGTYISFCEINCRRANAHEFRTLGIRGGNETHGQFLSALLIEMVLIKWISV